MRPKDLYELCEMTCKAMEARPLNYYQDAWATPVREVWSHEHDSKPVPQEACGTAFCRAGWMMAILHGHSAAAEDAGIACFSTIGDLFKQAGIPDWDINRLFAGAGWDANFGTKAYVKKGVQGLREFMKTFEGKLKAGKLTRDGRLALK